MKLTSNEIKDLKHLFKKRDLIEQLIELGYDLQPELEHVYEAIERRREELKLKC